VRQTGAPPAGLATPLQYVKGVGPHRAKLLAKKDEPKTAPAADETKAAVAE